MAPQDEPIDTPIGDSREGSVPAQRYVRMRKSELLEELVARDDQIADLYQQLAAALNANVDDNIDAGDGHADTTDTQSPARRGTAEKSTKIPDPPIFYNERDRDTEEFEQWYRDIKNKLEVNGDHFRNDRARQAYVESRLGGKAKRELAPYLRDTYPAPINTSSKLLAHLWRQYYDPTTEQMALDEYDNLKLKPGDDFLAFKNDFVRLAGETGKPRSTWKHEFNRKLYDSFQRSMVPSFASPAVTFDQFVVEAQQIAIIDKRASERQATNRQNSNNATRGSRGGTRGPRFLPRKQGTTVTKPLSADDVKRLYEEGRCFICREKGHLANDCLQKEKSDRPRRSDQDREARVARLQKRWATKSPETLYKDDDSTTVAEDSASEQEKLSALGKVDSLPGKVSVAKGRDYVSELLGGKPLVIECTIANNGVSLTTHDALADTGADGYLFVSTSFAKQLRKLLQVKRFKDFRPRPIGGFDNYGATQWINSTVRGHLTVQGRTGYDESFLVIDSSHDVMIGRKWFERHDVLIDCKRRRLLFPPEWEPDPRWMKGANIPLDQSPAKRLDREAVEGICRRERLMDEEDRRRRAGRAAVKKRIAELEAMVQPQPEPKAVENPPGEDVAGEEEWEVEKILASRTHYGKLQYQAQWRGWDPDVEWYPASDFRNAPAALKRFHDEYPEQAGPPARLDEWLLAAAEDRFAEPHLDDDRPVTKGKRLRRLRRKK